jgi:hypothetical protein
MRSSADLDKQAVVFRQRDRRIDLLHLLEHHDMRRFRFHIGSLILLILVLAIAFAALRESNQMWESSVFPLTVATLLTSVLLATHRTGERWTFWLGFALFGWAYLGLSLVPSIEPRLVTTKVLAFIDSRISRSSPAGITYVDYDNDGTLDLFVANNSQPNALYVNKGNGAFEDVTMNVALDSATNGIVLLGNPVGLGRSGTTESFLRIGHSLLVLILAVAGGRLSRLLYIKHIHEFPRT